MADNKPRRSAWALSNLKRLISLVPAYAAFMATVGAHAGDKPPLEYQVKAAFLVKFAMFVEWPTPQIVDTPFTIGILGEDPFGGYFDKAVEGQRINGHPIVVRRASDLSELTNCPIVFIGASEAKRVAELLPQLADKPILTVADTPDFARLGGMISFIKTDGKVRFEINTTATARGGLKLSAKLLQVAKIVSPPAARGGS